MTLAVLSDDDVRGLERCIARGGVAVFPTDTVYGVGCDPESEAAVRRMYRLKGRRADRPAAVMFFALPAALRALGELDPRDLQAVRALLPGPVTLLLENPDHRFPLACAGDPDTIGVRVPLFAGRLAPLSGCSAAVLQSSANLSGEHDVRRLADVSPRLLDAVDLALDGGELTGVSSTVVDLRGYRQTGAFSVIREGALGAGAVEHALADASGK